MMFTKIMVKAWLVISYAGMDEGTYVYLLEDKGANIHLSVRQKEPLPYVGGYIRLSGEIECEEVKQLQYHRVSTGSVYSKHWYCSSSLVKEEPCTEAESMVVGGKRFC